MKTVKYNSSSKFEFESVVLDCTGLVDEMLYELARSNAKFLGNAMEDILASTFINIKKLNGIDVNDLVSDSNMFLELRCLSKKTGINFEASVNCGGGRDFTAPEATVKKLNETDGWIFADLSVFPLVTLHYFSKERVMTFVKNNRKQDKLLSFNRKVLATI